MSVRNVGNNNQPIVGDSNVASTAIQNIAPGEPHPFVGPLNLQSDQAKRAVQTSLTYIGNQSQTLGIKTPSKELVAGSVVTDEIGMTHVRLDRVYKGLKVFGEQV